MIQTILPLSVSLNDKKYVNHYVFIENHVVISIEPFEYEKPNVLYIPHHLIIQKDKLYIKDASGRMLLLEDITP